MERALSILASPAAAFGLVAALAWAPATGFPTWPAFARGRVGSSLGISLAVGLFVFGLTRAVGAAAGG